MEAEGQLVQNLGRQDHLEVNVLPVMARWHRIPWSRRVDTSVAFGLGLSYATELPDVEVELCGDSRQPLVHWVVEIAGSPARSPW
jgi:hypothetical protein